MRTWILGGVAVVGCRNGIADFGTEGDFTGGDLCAVRGMLPRDADVVGPDVRVALGIPAECVGEIDLQPIGGERVATRIEAVDELTLLVPFEPLAPGRYLVADGFGDNTFEVREGAVAPELSRPSTPELAVATRCSSTGVRARLAVGWPDAPDGLGLLRLSLLAESGVVATRTFVPEARSSFELTGEVLAQEEVCGRVEAVDPRDGRIQWALPDVCEPIGCGDPEGIRRERNACATGPEPVGAVQAVALVLAGLLARKRSVRSRV